MSQTISVGDGKDYAKQIDEKNNGQFSPVEIPQEGGNDNSIPQQYPVDVKQSMEMSNSVEDESIIKSQIRNGFIRKVYGIVVFQLTFTFFFILICHSKTIKSFIAHNQALWTLLFCSSIICFIVSSCILICKRGLARKVPHNYIILFFVTLSESIVCATASLQYSFEIVVASIILTIAATLGIIIYTLRSKRDLSSCGMALTAFVAQLFFFGFINLFIRSRFLDMLYCLAATALVGMYLVYDVQLISGKFGKEYEIDDYIFAAMELYIDIIRLFMQILRILGKLQRRN